MAAPLQKTSDIRQQKGDGDCGLACVSFLRYGGGQVKDQLTEGGKKVTEDFINDFHDAMRQQFGLPDDMIEDSGLTMNKVAFVAQQFCRVGRRPGQVFDMTLHQHRTQWAPDQIEGVIRDALAADPRGVILATGEADSAHAIVATTLSTDVVGNRYLEGYDPAPLRGGTFAMDITLDVPLFLQEGSSFTDRFEIVHGERLPTTDPHIIEKGAHLGKLLASGSFGSKEVPLVATTKAVYRYNHVDADAIAKQLPSSTLVLEDPPGTFAIVCTSNVSKESAPDGGQRDWTRFASVKFLLADQKKFETLHVGSKSHRNIDVFEKYVSS